VGGVGGEKAGGVGGGGGESETLNENRFFFSVPDTGWAGAATQKGPVKADLV